MGRRTTWTRCASGCWARRASRPPRSSGPRGRRPRRRSSRSPPRDRDAADAFAAKHGVPQVFARTPTLIADPDIDAVYNPLPNGLHAGWTDAALDAGKHVLCEKPFTANADEAEQVAAAAGAHRAGRDGGVPLPLPPARRAHGEIVERGELGTLRHVRPSLCFPLPLFSDIRYKYELAGGALMDAACYAVHMARLLGGEEPDGELGHRKLRTPDVDRAMRAELRFPSGHTGAIQCSMWSTTVLKTSHARVVGEHGELRVINPANPQLWHRIRYGRRPTRTEHVPRVKTYEVQLEAFRGGAAGRADADAAVGLGRQHARHRRHLSRRGHEGARHVVADRLRAPIGSRHDRRQPGRHPPPRAHGPSARHREPHAQAVMAAGSAMVADRLRTRSRCPPSTMPRRGKRGSPRWTSSSSLASRPAPLDLPASVEARGSPASTCT